DLLAGGPAAEVHVALDLRALAGERGLLRLRKLPAPAVEVAPDARPIEAALTRRMEAPGQLNAAAALEVIAVDARYRAAVELDLAQLAAAEIDQADDPARRQAQRNRYGAGAQIDAVVDPGATHVDAVFMHGGRAVAPQREESHERAAQPIIRRRHIRTVWRKDCGLAQAASRDEGLLGRRQRAEIGEPAAVRPLRLGCPHRGEVLGAA